MPDSKETEDQILDAAREEFQQKGFSGARMQAIADQAGINKSMLHYYYRSKDKLFQRVFQEAVKRFFPIIFEVLDSDLDLQPKVQKLIETYHSLLKENPYLPQFIIHEMNQHPDRFRKFMVSQHVKIPQLFVKQIREQVEAGKLRPIEPPEFVINTIALCIFPYIAQNMVKVVFGMNDEGFERFVDSRAEGLSDFIFNGVKK